MGDFVCLFLIDIKIHYFSISHASRVSVCLQVRSDSGPEPQAWSFNLSHQGDYAVLAAEQGMQVGVDIMKTTMPGKCYVNS